MDVVEAKEISKIYKTMYGKVVALQNVNLKIGKGITGIAGPNGSGKTTLLKIMIGLAKPTSGTIKIWGEKPEKSEIKKKISFLPEKPVFPKTVTVRELTRYVSKIKGIPFEELVNMLNYLEIYDLDRKVGALSAGMTQKVGLSYSLASSQELIILDEPTANLDPVWRKNVLQMIRKKGRESTIIFSTHLLHDIEKIANNIVFMNNGKVLINGPINEIMERYGKVHYKIIMKNNDVVIADDLSKFVREDIKKIDVEKMDLEDIFEVILNERAN